MASVQVQERADAQHVGFGQPVRDGRYDAEERREVQDAPPAEVAQFDLGRVVADPYHRAPLRGLQGCLDGGVLSVPRREDAEGVPVADGGFVDNLEVRQAQRRRQDGPGSFPVRGQPPNFGKGVPSQKIAQILMLVAAVAIEVTAPAINGQTMLALALLAGALLIARMGRRPGVAEASQAS